MTADKALKALSDIKTIALIGVAVGVAVWFKKKGGLQAINPLNNDNVINQGFTAAYQKVTGSAGTLGTDLYDVLHDEEGGNKLDVTNQNNYVNTATNSLYQRLTGSTGSIGTDLYDWMHGGSL